MVKNKIKLSTPRNALTHLKEKYKNKFVGEESYFWDFELIILHYISVHIVYIQSV